MDTHTFEWHIGEVDLSAVIRDAINATSQLMAEKNILLIEEIPAEAVYVHGDRDRLIQVMLNLISNAIKFCDPNNGEIVIRLKTHKNEVQVDVKDNGRGIPKKEQEAIFEKFHQVRDGVGNQPGGSGLGLTITKRIIDYHKGKIWVKSQPGKGATFSFTLALAESAQTIPIEDEKSPTQ